MQHVCTASWAEASSSVSSLLRSQNAVRRMITAGGSPPAPCPMLECIGAVDQGTQSTRFILYSVDTAAVVGSHSLEFKQIRQKPGWLEHDPQELLDSVHTCIAQCLKTTEAEHGALRVKAVGITNQRETTLVWDRHSLEALHNAIVWPDSRTAAVCQAMRQEDHFLGITGLPISTYFSAYKFRWLLENDAAVREAVEAGTCLLGTVDAWLLHNLTGAFVTDVTNAARTNLMELTTQQWHTPTLKIFGVREGMLPEIRSSAEHLGTLQEGPLKGVPVTGCLGDQHAALLGQQCVQHQAKNTYGTGCFLLLHTGDKAVRSQHGLITTLAHKLGPAASVQYALEGAIAVGGAGVSWLRDNLGLIGSAAEVEQLAGSVDSTEGVYLVPAFNGLLAPRWRSDARGTIVGLSGSSTKAHIARAMLEAICWQTKEVMDAMTADVGLQEAHCLRVDGGASTNDLLMQLQADLLQVDVERPDNLETTALGAAYAAGIGAGIWTQDWVMQQRVTAQHGPKLRRTFSAQAEKAQVDLRYRRWQKAVQRSLELDDLVDETSDPGQHVPA